MSAPAANQVTGDKVIIQYSTDGTTYTALGAIEKVRGNKVKAPTVKTTKVDSGVERKQPGIPDWGNIEIELRYNKALVNTILGWQTNQTMLYLKAIPYDHVSTGATTDSTEVVTGFVAEFDPLGEMVNNKEVISTILFEIDGAGTWTAGT